MNRRIIGYYNYTVVLTYLGMIAAVIGVFLAIGGFFGSAVWCLMVAGLCDMFDGAVASTKKRDENQKRFGIQIDSLCDLIGFGVLPGFFCYLISYTENKITGGIAALMIILAAVIRLAYFNVLEENRQKEETGNRKVFLGVPVTTIALVLPIVYVLYHNGIFSTTYCFQIVIALTAAGFLTTVDIPKEQKTGKIVLLAVGILEALAMGFFGR